MLKKIRRISDVGSIKGVETISTPFLILKFKKNGDDLTKFAFTISKKVDKRAVVRNKIKRNLANSIAETLNSIEEGYSIIIIARSALLEKDSKGQSEVLKEILLKAKLLK